MKKAEHFYTSVQAAAIMQLDVSRVLQLCRQKRLGYTSAKFGKQWVITDAEIAEYQRIGALAAGRPVKPE